MHLADVIDRWVGRVEIVLAGADDDLRAGEEALAVGDPLGARAAARRVLSRAPNSALGLALLADACEAAGLEAELAQTLEDLAKSAPSRAEVLVRLGAARAATGGAPEEVRDAFVRALAVADAGSESRRDALLGLADLDLAQGEGARAELWLERTGHDPSPAIVVRRAEVRLWRGDAAGTLALLDGVTTATTDGRAALVRGRALAQLGQASAFVPLVRAMVLDAPGASEALSAALAHVPSDPQTRTRLHSVVDAKGQQDLARWRAAFARAEGAREAARIALREAVAAGDRAAAPPLLDAALEDHDRAALKTALAAAPQAVPDSLRDDATKIAAALELHGAAAFDALDPIAHARCVGWAEVIAGDLAREWVPPGGAAAAWVDLLGRLDRHAHSVGDRDVAAAITDLAAERSRPVRLAVVGEFNAGKSTFINALIGTDVAPTGVLPTTATIHDLRWAPDPFAKIVFVHGHEPSERIVALGELRATLLTLDPATLARVELRMPLPGLVRVEILDTPGFNAPDRRHADTARSVFEEADVAIWLLDGTQALKESERAVLQEAERGGLPVRLLVNKADRLQPGDLAKVMQNIEVALAERRLAPWGATFGPPLAFSAKKALAGKLGDARALAESGWDAVEAFLEQEIIARSEELKERALRRRAAALVERLRRSWQAQASVDQEALQRHSAQAHQAAQAAAQIEGDAEATAAKLAASLSPHVESWTRDVDLVFVGRDRESARRDPVLARYRIDRALATLAPPLARALASLAPAGSLSPADLMSNARAIVRAAAASSAPDDPSVVASAAAVAGIATLADDLFARSAAVLRPGPAAGILRELRAFAAALAQGALD